MTKQQVFTTHGIQVKSQDQTAGKSVGEQPINVLISHDIQTFLGEVSIGGIKYTVIPKASFIRRAVWLSMVLAGAGFAFYQIVDRVTYYQSWPTSVNIRINHVQEIRFPTVTICNENRIELSKMLALGGQEAVDLVRGMNPPLSYGSDIPESLLNEVAGQDGVDWNAMYQAVAQNLSESLIYCLWEGEFCSPDIFKQVPTNIGFCYQFNSAGQNYRTGRAGASYGLKLIMRVGQHEYLAPVRGSVSAGFRIGLHTPEVTPMMREWGFRVSPGRQTLIAVTAHKVVDHGPPHTNCSNEEGYSYNGCLTQCETDYVVKNCSCKDLYMPGNASICNPVETHVCVIPALDRYIKDGTAEECDCLRQCNNTEYTYAISSAPASDYFINYMTPLVAGFSGNRDPAEFLSKEFVMVEIFFSEVAYNEMLTVPGYTPLALLCDIGGALGLVLGSTLLTVLEVVDFVLVTAWHACITRKVRVDNKN